MQPTKQQQQQQTQQQTKQEKVQNLHEQTEEGKKDPETLSEGERMGLSKQQLRKLEKRLAAKKKKQTKEQEDKKKQIKQHKQQKKQKKIKEKEKEKQLPEEYLKEFNTQKIPINPNKNVPLEGEQNVLITSALPYVNNVPHLGNIIGCVLSADVYSRFKKLQGANVLYVCGTDEYGTATEVKALQEKKTPKQICDFYHKIHSQVYQWFDIGFDHFGRTSTDWHSKICQQIFLQIRKNNLIQKQEMTQCYCESCDLFLADRFVCGTCPYCGYEDARGDQCDKCQKLFNNPTQMKNYYCHVCKKTPILRNTVHFFIDLPNIQKDLQKWIQQSSIKGKWSENSIATTKAWTNMGLKSKCITRDLKWGVSVPIQEYKQKVFYVWFDAPIGYISITANLLGEDYKKWWKSPENVKLYQFMGKDNIPFHTVIFPSSLIGTKQNWTLLHHISTTEYLNYQAGKFSKRNGTGVFGDTASTTGIPSEVWRYYLLVNRPERSDSQFSWKQFIDRNNNELLANLGNLCNRALKYTFTNYNKQIPKVTLQKLTEVETNFLKSVQERYVKYLEALNSVQIKEGLKIAMEISSLGNKYLQDSKFWEKINVESGRTETVIGTICNFIRFVSLVFEPYMPSTSAKINFLLGVQKDERNQKLGKILNSGEFTDNFFSLTRVSTELQQPVPLFCEYTEDQMNQWRQKFAGKQN